MIKKIVIVLAGSILLLNSCYNDKEEILYPKGNCDNVSTSFTAVVNPLISSKCAIPDCHGAGSTNGPGALTSYNVIKENAVRIRQALASGFMPPDNGPELSTSERRSIICWIDNGAPNN